MGKRTNYHAKFEEHFAYHIYNRSINKEKIFKKEENYKFFLRRVKILIAPFFEVESYCLMPNHFHFLMRVKPVDDHIIQTIKLQGTSKSKKFLNQEIDYNDFLVDQFKRLFQSYAGAYNKQENRNGSVFQAKFKRILIKHESQWLHILAYIHHNPIHHKLEMNYVDWKYSSYSTYLSMLPTLMSRKKVLLRFDENIEEAQKALLIHHRNFKFEQEMMEFYLDHV